MKKLNVLALAVLAIGSLTACSSESTEAPATDSKDVGISINVNEPEVKEDVGVNIKVNGQE